AFWRFRSRSGTESIFVVAFTELSGARFYAGSGRSGILLASMRRLLESALLVRLVALAAALGAAALLAGRGAAPGLRAGEVAAALALVLTLLVALDVARRLAAPGAEARLEDLLRWAARAGEGRAAVLAHALLLAVSGAALLGAETLRPRASRALDPAALAPMGGYAFAAEAPDARPDGRGGDSTLEVLEDGRALGPAHVFAEGVALWGRGRYRHDARVVLFSSSDGSDPRTNGRRYELRWSWSPGPLLLAALVIGATVLNARRAARALAWLERAPPAALTALVVAVALAFRVQVALREPALTFGGHLVKGALHSDARDWFDA